MNEKINSSCQFISTSTFPIATKSSFSWRLFPFGFIAGKPSSELLVQGTEGKERDERRILGFLNPAACFFDIEAIISALVMVGVPTNLQHGGF